MKLKIKEYDIAKKREEKYKINSKINALEVRVIDEKGDQRGVMSLKDAIYIANEVGLDLVEIAPNSKPPVCKILDFGKFRYEIEKQQKLNKKKQHIIHVKEIRFRPNTGEHDLITKINRGKKFLENGDKLKVTIMFRGREMHNRQEYAKGMLDMVIDILKDVSVVDKPADLQGRRLSIILSPK
tara:strand:- start:72 stop:620 length:549 start_codon:yes stop_codon:yes gene_type:complete